MKSPLEQFDMSNMKNMYMMNIDMTMQNMFMPLMCMMLCVLMYMFMNMYNISLMPMYVQYMMELIYKFMIGLVKQQMGNYGLFWMPFVFNLFNFILLCNMLSLMPFGMALTSQFMLMFWLSCTICTSIFIMGLLRFNLKFLHMFMPQSPFILLPLLMPMEMFSYMISLLSLAISLAANMIAGHTLVHMMVNFFFKIMKIDKILCMMMLMPLFLILMLEMGVAFLQAYVFTVLFCMYLKDTEKGAMH